MNDILLKHLALAVDKRLAVFKQRIQDESLLQEEMQLRAAAYMISEIVQPCCCMLCNKVTLALLLENTRLCKGRTRVIERLASLVYDDLARCNGFG